MIEIKKDLVNLMGGYTLNYDPNNNRTGFNKNYLEHASVIFEVSQKKIKSNSRERKLVWIRYALYNYLKTVGSMTLTEIGKVFNRDHATVIHGIKKHNDFINWNDREYIEMNNYFNERI